MNAYASKYLQGADLAGLMKELLITPKQCAKFLQVTERTVFRWLADESAPFSAVALLWHETPKGQQVTACHVGNKMAIYYRLSEAHKLEHGKALDVLRRVLAISDTGAANDPLLVAPPFPGNAYQLRFFAPSTFQPVEGLAVGEKMRVGSVTLV